MTMHIRYFIHPALAAGLLLAVQSVAPVARADSVPEALAGKWVCTFDTGDVVTILGVSGASTVEWQYNTANVRTEVIAEAGNGGIEVNHNDFDWVLWPVSASEAGFTYYNKNVHRRTNASCSLSP
jgi:hypothetical protein